MTQLAPERIDRYWSAFFGLAPAEILRPGICVVAHARLAPYNGAWIFRRGCTVVISAPEERVAEVDARAARIPLEEMQSEAAIRALFGGDVERLIGPAFQGHLRDDEFRPVRSPSVRTLLPADRPALEALRAACDPLEWEHSNLGREDTEVFGCFDGETLAAAAKNIMRAPDAADHGVIAHPGFRGRGFGRAVASAAIESALGRGHLILYQTLVANAGAVGVARALGVSEYARHVAVRFR